MPAPTQLTFESLAGLKREDALALELAGARRNFETLQEQFEDVQKLYREVVRERDELRHSKS